MNWFGTAGWEVFSRAGLNWFGNIEDGWDWWLWSTGIVKFSHDKASDA